MEVYRKVLREAEYHQDEAKKFSAMDTRDAEIIEAHQHQVGLSQCFYQVAAWLEDTEEINPTKN